MDRISVALAILSASIAHAPSALSQTECSIECPRERPHFKNCDSHATEQPGRDRVAIVGRVISRGVGEYCKPRLTVEVLSGPNANLPSQMEIDYDPCLIWT